MGRGNQQKSEFNFQLKGPIHSSTAYNLSSEFLKHVLYQRHQIPLPYQHLEREIIAKIQKSEDKESKTVKRSIRSGDHRAKGFIDLLNSLLNNLDKAFSQAGSCITQVVIVLGATVVSPKEIFVLKFPDTNLEGEKQSSGSCVRSFFQQIISLDMFGDMKQISPCGLHLMLEAPRDCDLEWFLPKATYKLPVRGNQFIFNLENADAGTTVCEDLSILDETSFNMSGICPLDNTYEAESSTNESNVINISSESDSGVCDEDLIWYQAPVVIKGFRDKGHKF